jgi:hypothetical protein
MARHPTDLPDTVARKLADMARAHGYGIERLTLTWMTKDLRHPMTARAEYAPDIVESVDVQGRLTRQGEL